METDAPFVRADGIVELHTIADVVLHFAFVVDPGHAESDDAVRFDHPLDDAVALEFGVAVIDAFHRKQHFAHCLQILFLTWVFRLKGAHDIIYIHNLCCFGLLVMSCLMSGYGTCGMASCMPLRRKRAYDLCYHGKCST